MLYLPDLLIFVEGVVHKRIRPILIHEFLDFVLDQLVVPLLLQPIILDVLAAHDCIVHMLDHVIDVLLAHLLVPELLQLTAARVHVRLDEVVVIAVRRLVLLPRHFLVDFVDGYSPRLQLHNLLILLEFLKNLIEGVVLIQHLEHFIFDVVH